MLWVWNAFVYLQHKPTQHTMIQVTEGMKFTVATSLNGQAGRKFIKGSNGVVTSTKTVMAGTKYETTTIVFQITPDGIGNHKAVGGVCEFDLFLQSVTA